MYLFPNAGWSALLQTVSSSHNTRCIFLTLFQRLQTTFSPTDYSPSMSDQKILLTILCFYKYSVKISQSCKCWWWHCHQLVAARWQRPLWAHP